MLSEVLVKSLYPSPNLRPLIVTSTGPYNRVLFFSHEIDLFPIYLCPNPHPARPVEAVRGQGQCFRN